MSKALEENTNELVQFCKSNSTFFFTPGELPFTESLMANILNVSNPPSRLRDRNMVNLCLSIWVPFNLDIIKLQK